MSGVARKDWPKVVAMRAHGASLRVIAEELGVAHQNIAATLKIPEVDEQLQELQSGLDPMLKQAMRIGRTEAFETLLDALRDPDPHVKVKAAIAILDRTGVTAGHKVEINTGTEFDPDEAVEELRRMFGGEAGAQGEQGQE